MLHMQSSSVSKKSFWNEWRSELRAPAYWCAIAALLVSTAVTVLHANGNSSLDVFGSSFSFFQAYIVAALFGVASLYFYWPNFIAQWRGDENN
jgi:uncharacterized membrane protein